MEGELNLLPLCCSQTSCDCYFLRESSGAVCELAWDCQTTRWAGIFSSGAKVLLYPNNKQILQEGREPERWSWWAQACLSFLPLQKYSSVSNKCAFREDEDPLSNSQLPNWKNAIHLSWITSGPCET
jgi:hypothetical protein